LGVAELSGVSKSTKLLKAFGDVHEDCDSTNDSDHQKTDENGSPGVKVGHVGISDQSGWDTSPGVIDDTGVFTGEVSSLCIKVITDL